MSDVIQIIQAADCQSQPWANGAGSTREIHRQPCAGDAGNADWNWRLSIADVVQDAPFSSFAGIDRILVLLSGTGIELCFDGGRVVRLESPYAMTRFAGEESLSGGPIDGPTTDFNLMWRRDRFDAELWVRPMVGSLQIFAQPGESWALHVAAGRASLDGAGVQLDSGDTALLIDDGGTRRLRVDGAGTALLIRLQERQPDR